MLATTESRRPLLAASVILGIVAMVALLITVLGTGSSAAAGTQAESVGPDVGGSYSTLQKSETSRDHLDGARVGGVPNGVGANSALARRTDDGTDGTTRWLVPGNHAVCVVAELASGGGGGTSCRAIANAGSEGLVMTLNGGDSGAPGLRPHEVIVVGAVPDGVGQVILTMANGAKRSLPVSNNSYTADVDGQPANVSFTTPAGKAAVEKIAAYTG